MTSLSSLSALISICVCSSVALADDWKESVSFSRAESSSIRVVDPEGYTVTVTVNDQVLKDTVPANIRVPQGDNFYVVAFTAPNGKTWSKKIEVKRYQTTELRVKHTVDAPSQKAEPAKKRAFIGTIFNRMVKTCGKKYEFTARLDFLDAAGNAAAQLNVDSGKFNQTQIPAGAWDVRAYIWDGREWLYQTTQKVQIAGDNWEASLGCPDRGAFAITFK